MADFFSRIFAIPSDDESYSADDTYSQSSSIQRQTTPPRKSDRKNSSKARGSRRSSTPDDSIDEHGIDESSNSISLDEDERLLRNDKKDHRGRQRRNDEPSGHRSASEPRKEKKKRSSSERPGAIHASSKHSQQSRYRNARSLSKVSERHVSAPTSPPNADDHEADDTQKKMKGWRSKFSAGMKKHLSPASASSSPPVPSKQVKKSKPDKSTNVPQHTPSQPVNVGDFITISQQYLEENADMSVLTLPRELHNKEMDEENLMQIVGQKGVLGNNAVQAFLDRRSAGADKKGDDIYIQQSTSVESKGMYERVSSYATKLLDISYSQSLENNSTENVDEVQDLLALANHQVGKHAWPCDPTAEGYTPAGTGSGSVGVTAAASSTSVLTEQEIGSIGVPPPPSPSALLGDSEQKSHKFSTNNQMAFHSETDTKYLESEEKPRPFDEPSSSPAESAPEPERSNKSVSFCLPPPSSHPPAPPFLGPTLDYYYSMERSHQDQMPIWSNSTVLPPIIELWSSVEDGANSAGVSLWSREKENVLIGEDAPLLVSDGMIEDVDGAQNNVQKEPLCSPKSRARQPITSPTSPGEKSIEYFNDILDCNGDEDDAPLDEKEDLKVVPATTSSLSIDTDPAMSSESQPTGEDASFRHRSQWKSPHNMTYRPPMFNNTGVQKDANGLNVGKSESSEDSVLHLRRLHGDGTQSHDSNRPIILHGRVVRHGNVSSIARSPSSSSYGSSSSHNAKTFAAIVIQAATRGMLERQRFMVMINSVLVIQPAVRRFLCKQRYMVHLKLKRSYFPSKWKRKVTNENGVCV